MVINEIAKSTTKIIEKLESLKSAQYWNVAMTAISSIVLLVGMVIGLIALWKNITQKEIKQLTLVEAIEKLTKAKMNVGETRSENVIISINQSDKTGMAAEIAQMIEGGDSNALACTVMLTKIGKSEKIPCCLELEQFLSGNQNFPTRSLLLGPPGVGKTYVAELLSGKTGGIVLKFSAQELFHGNSKIDFSEKKKGQLCTLINNINEKFKLNVILVIDELDKAEQLKRGGGVLNSFIDEAFPVSPAGKFRNTIIVTGNEKDDAGYDNWLANMVKNAESNKAEQVNTTALSIDRLKAGGLYKFELLDKKQAKEKVENSTLLNSDYVKLDYEARGKVKEELRRRIDACNKDKCSLRDLESMIGSCVNDYNVRKNHCDFIDGVLGQMDSLAQDVRNQKKYGSKVAELAPEKLRFGEDIGNGLADLKKDLMMLEDDKIDFSSKFNEAFSAAFKEKLKTILNARLDDLKTSFGNSNDIDTLFSDRLLTDFTCERVIREYGGCLVGVIDQAILMLDLKVAHQYIQQELKDDNSRNVDGSVSIGVNAEMQKAFDKKPGWFSSGRQFMKPEEIKTIADDKMKPYTKVKSAIAQPGGNSSGVEQSA
ncbi:MAG: AAA family ATPase [Rickettsiaceae bacterium H1]|nr:AAA family ATPase [Rickettsiaceae bacterium H1]